MTSDILFLDFDGVLHPVFPRTDRTHEENQHFVGSSRLASILDRVAPNIKIVVSSTWRVNRSLEELRALCGPLGKYIIDKTPNLNIRQEGCREMEAQLWRQQNGHTGRWCALDDVAGIWVSQLKLMVTDDGFRWADGISLELHIEDILDAPEAELPPMRVEPMQIYLPDDEPGDIVMFGHD